ncbi:MAG TPA: serine hydrolase domain-containing protein [Terriglobales bacterium]|nr:serine hydrolase domain-containing protein [Terriglobales bacterium]
MMKLFRSFFFSLFTAAVVFAPAVLRAQRETEAARQNVSEARVSAADLHRAVAPQVKDLTIDENRLRTHVMRPQHIVGVISDHGREEGKLEFVPKKGIFGPRVAHHLDVDAFTKALHAALKDQVAGYAMRLRQHGQTIETLEWQWAQTPQDGSEGWNPDRLMHVASVSKLITAMAMTKLLNEKNISYDAKIINYLPTYWTKGPNIDKITFRNLMTHTSGFTSDTDFESMKAAVAAGVSTDPNAADHVGHYHYENMNFGLCRIMIPVINGNIAKGANFFFPPPLTFLNDQLWDAITIGGYNQYVQNKVFAPAGVTTATLDHPGAGVLAYKFPVSTAGWNSGSLESVSGGAGWHLSVDQLLNVMGTFRRGGSIMSPTAAQTMLDNGFGIDLVGVSTPAGKLYNKNGLWHDAGVNGRTEQSLAYFLPEDMELVVLANSPIGNPEQFFRNVVTQIYVDNIK